MPKSKRDKIISLTQTTKKGRAHKEQLVSKMQEAVDAYKYCYVISCENYRNLAMKEVRSEWVGSRFFFGKNKVMQIALGRNHEEEYKPNLAKISKCVLGDAGLLFTDSAPKTVQDWFKAYEVPNYPRAGFVATKDVSIPAGPFQDFPTSMEPGLRKLGLPTAVKDGQIVLIQDVQVCSVGDTLTPEQCVILERFDHPMAIFRCYVHAYWKDGKYKELDMDSLHRLQGGVVSDEINM